MIKAPESKKLFVTLRVLRAKCPSTAVDDKRGHRVESEAPYRISIIMSSSSSDESLL